MSLTLLFDPLPTTLFDQINSEYALKNSISWYHTDFPDWQTAHIALIGLSEVRGSKHNSNTINGADAIRSRFYGLQQSANVYNIVDLGNLRSGPDLQDTYLRIKQICADLITHGVFPILLGGSHDLCYGQFTAFEDMNKQISMLNIDAFIDMDENADDGQDKHHLYKILGHPGSFLYDYTHLAHQTYLVAEPILSAIERMYFSLIRLGSVREKMKENEPYIRNADFMAFDVCAIRMADMPAHAHAPAFGLSAEEACQLCWYAGQSSRLASTGFYGYDAGLDNRDQGASVIATMIWYLIEGFYNRQKESNFNSNGFVCYLVSLSAHPHQLIFYKSKLTDKWWMQVPYRLNHKSDNRQYYLPCSYQDYLAATAGELPDRWIQMQSKL